jgi:hypothetical protein
VIQVDAAGNLNWLPAADSMHAGVVNGTPRQALYPRTPAVQHERHDRANQEYDEQYLGDSGRARGDSTKPKYCGDQCDDQKYDSVVQHSPSPQFVVMARSNSGP